ncbi:MAG: sigma-70 family RNA polymerase sigma factor [Myxococcota bacterium]
MPRRTADSGRPGTERYPMPLGDPAELRAVARLGREEALAEVFTDGRSQLRSMVRRRLDRRLSRRVDPSDVLQEGYLEAAQRLDDYLADPPMPLFAWLKFLVRQRVTAIHRQHFSVQKRDARREQWSVPQADDGNASHAAAMDFSANLTSPSQVVVRNDLSTRLQKLIDGMHPRDREILSLRHFEELSNGDAAEALGISAAAASKRYLRALERLKTVTEPLRGSAAAN